jgi:hypothetical protein
LFKAINFANAHALYHADIPGERRVVYIWPPQESGLPDRILSHLKKTHAETSESSS